MAQKPAKKPYARGTKVSIDTTIEQVRRVVRAYKGTNLTIQEGEDRAAVVFLMQDRLLRFELTMPDFNAETFQFALAGARPPQPRSRAEAADRWEQACRERWRQLALVIRAKLVAVEAGVSQFEDEFLANIVMPDGETVSQKVRPQVSEAHLTKRPTRLLLGVKGDPRRG